MTFNEQGTKNAIMENTPICEDAVNIIMDMLKPPTFKVGKTYYQIYHWSDGRGGRVYKYKVVKRTKCFITIIDKHDTCEQKIRLKIRNYKNYMFEDKEIEEIVEINYKTLWACDEWKEDIHTIIYENYEPKVVRKGEELNHLLPKTKPPRVDIVNGVCYKYPTIKAPNPKLIKIQEERERKRKEIQKLQKEYEMLGRDESEILYADLDL